MTKQCVDGVLVRRLDHQAGLRFTGGSRALRREFQSRLATSANSGATSPRPKTPILRHGTIVTTMQIYSQVSSASIQDVLPGLGYWTVLAGPNSTGLLRATAPGRFKTLPPSAANTLRFGGS